MLIIDVLSTVLWPWLQRVQFISFKNNTVETIGLLEQSKYLYYVSTYYLPILFRTYFHDFQTIIETMITLSSIRCLKSVVANEVGINLSLFATLLAELRKINCSLMRMRILTFNYR